MRYGAFGLVEVVGSSNAVIVIDQMYPSLPGTVNAADTKLFL